jgi:hypothetical protein
MEVTVDTKAAAGDHTKLDREMRQREREREKARGRELDEEMHVRERRRPREWVPRAHAPFLHHLGGAVVNGVTVYVLRWRHFVLLQCSFTSILSISVTR